MKKTQKAVNKYVHEIRDKLQKDSSLGGRFDVKQYSASWKKLLDMPNKYVGYFVFELIDKKKDYHHYIYDIYCLGPKDILFSWDLLEEVNKFIDDRLWRDNYVIWSTYH